MSSVAVVISTCFTCFMTFVLCLQPFGLHEPFCSEWDCCNQDSMSDEKDLADFQPPKTKKNKAVPG